MKAFTSLVALTAAMSAPVSAYWKGFNIGANKYDGSCRTQEDWEFAFKNIQALPGYFSSARLYASSDCNTLANAVPAAIATGQTLLVGVWTEDENHYNAEKAALLSAIQNHGSDWLIAVTVGSEDLYRKDTDAQTLANQINDVRGMIRSVGAQQEVGHVDTWTAWVDGANEAVIDACDFLGMDGYPYFQDSSIEDASNVFYQSLDATRNVSKGKWVWITETGWPVTGDAMGAAQASLQNAQSYWNNVACSAFQQAHTFWYAYQDNWQSPSFGAFNQENNNIYVNGC